MNSVGGASFYILIEVALTVMKPALALSPALVITLVNRGLFGRLLRDIAGHLVAVPRILVHVSPGLNARPRLGPDGRAPAPDL